MGILINHTNYKSENWSDEQISCFDVVIEIPIPNIEHTFTTLKVKQMVEDIFLEIIDYINLLIPRYKEVGICLQGELTYCYLMYEKILELKKYYTERGTEINIYIPITKEVIKEDDNSSYFVFDSWRVI